MKANQFCGFTNGVSAFNKAAGLAVSRGAVGLATYCGATVRPKRGLASSAGALEAESPDPRGLGIPRCLVRPASGGCQ